MTSLTSEKVVLAGIINPAANAAGTLTTNWVSMATFEELLAIIAAGALGVNGTIDAKLQQAQDGTGTGAKDIVGKAITQLTQAGTDKSNKQAQINVRAEELDRNGGFSFVRLSMTTAVATSPSTAVLLGVSARYSPTAPAASLVETIK
ncbi:MULTISPECIES: hypothetical protein [unclassified Bradyrhizobium]|uniref:hypothetical protein n=1 Tax=Bradyrhizobium sp. USDA 4541 TaxID=2817704 RepID=UPI0020A37973|nr:hypothetical protein [Bradyrhizobium sp. USDA 4541]MCP1852802.1 hypothetical protein [Bradyrhizobium sp. USDA 4541]